jgi:hypothetical protein
MLSLDSCLLCDCDGEEYCSGVGSGFGLTSVVVVVTFWLGVSAWPAVGSMERALTMGAKLKENLRFMLGDGGCCAKYRATGNCAAVDTDDDGRPTPTSCLFTFQRLQEVDGFQVSSSCWR